MDNTNLNNQITLARRWGISPRTLEQWRWRGEGPQFLKIGSAVRYRLEDIEAYEQQHLLSNTGQINNSNVAGGKYE